jgi:cyclin C
MKLATDSAVDCVTSDTSKLGECEFQLISEMNSQLIVHHPYRDLTELQTTLGLNQEEFSLAWSIVNDHYYTDLPLIHPPHVIAVTAAFLAVVLKPGQGGQLQASNVQAAMQQAFAIGMGGQSAGPSSAVSAAATAAGSGQAARIQKIMTWLAESSVSIEAVVDCTQELISLYEIWDTFNDKPCKEAVVRFVKARGLDK